MYNLRNWPTAILTVLVILIYKILFNIVDNSNHRARMHTDCHISTAHFAVCDIYGHFLNEKSIHQTGGAVWICDTGTHKHILCVFF